MILRKKNSKLEREIYIKLKINKVETKCAVLLYDIVLYDMWDIGLCEL